MNEFYLKEENSENDKFYKSLKSGYKLAKDKKEIEKMDEIKKELKVTLYPNDDKWKYAVTIENKPYLNDVGLGLNIISDTNIEHNINQQIFFGQESWNSVINSYSQKEMVRDIIDNDNLNPPSGTPFFLLPFHCQHNQNNEMKSEKDSKLLNDMAASFFESVNSFKMIPENPKLKEMQTFKVQLL